MPHARHENAGFRFWNDAEGVGSGRNAMRDYRERAKRLRALAGGSLDPQIRAYLVTTAAQFDRLADYAAASARTHAA